MLKTIASKTMVINSISLMITLKIEKKTVQRKRVGTLSGHDVLYFIKYCNKLHWWLRKNDLLVTNMAFVYPFPILKIAFGKIKV